MDAKKRANFVDAYTKILTSSWSSEEYARRLDDDPRAALAEGGLRVPDDAEIEIVRAASGEPDLDAQIELWELGRHTGRYTIHVPPTPRVYTRDLTDNDLGAVSGGNAAACCSCCPCSCST
jgi:hypothetical protein